MIAIVGIVAFPTVLCLSLLLTPIASVALAYPGLSEEAVRFQTLSASTGTEFTTSETERVVDHPLRRRIVMMRMGGPQRREGAKPIQPSELAGYR